MTISCDLLNDGRKCPGPMKLVWCTKALQDASPQQHYNKADVDEFNAKTHTNISAHPDDLEMLGKHMVKCNRCAGCDQLYFGGFPTAGRQVARDLEEGNHWAVEGAAHLLNRRKDWADNWWNHTVYGGYYVCQHQQHYHMICLSCVHKPLTQEDSGNRNAKYRNASHAANDLCKGLHGTYDLRNEQHAFRQEMGQQSEEFSKSHSKQVEEDKGCCTMM